MKPTKFLNCEVLLNAGNKALQLLSNKFIEVQNLKHPVLPNVQPGFLRSQLPQRPPMQAESMETILKDMEQIVFPGLTLWSHPNFYAYYPSNLTHASIIADMIVSAFGTPGFIWMASPAQTELENIMMDWIVHAMRLPEHFYLKNTGGGTIANTASDAQFLTIHVAKWRKMNELGIQTDNPKVLKFVGYYGECSHSAAIKGLILKDIPYRRMVPTYYDEEIQNYQIDLLKFKEILNEDIKNGLIPFWFSGTWGTTSTCAKEQLDALGTICQQHNMWFNVDAAYLGSSWVLPQYRDEAIGLEMADSLQINFSKMMMTGIGGSLFYVKNKQFLSEAMGSKLEFSILQNKYTSEYDVTDYKDWQVALGRRFNSLKLWFMIRSLGIEGMKEQLEDKIILSQYFTSLINSSTTLLQFTKNEFTLSTFVVNHENIEIRNTLTRELYKRINEDTTHGFISGSEVKGLFFLRVAIGSHTTTKEHLLNLYLHIETLSCNILKEYKQ